MQPKSRGRTAACRLIPRRLVTAADGSRKASTGKKDGMRKTTPAEVGNEMVELGEVM
jgi:hypothetical protein